MPDERILATDWSSPELFACPEFQQLRQWVRDKEIQAIGLFDRDRLEAKGLQRLIFISDCKDAGVDLVLCQGPELVDGPEGQLVELALALGKEHSVSRAKQGARDGMHDKVTRDRRPVSKHRVFGYMWEGDRKLVPNDDWNTVKLIFDIALHRQTISNVKRDLERHKILSPSGKPIWERSTIFGILRNPIYAGRYYGLKSQVRAPNRRKGNTYGYTSAKHLPLEECVYLPDVEVVNPPIIWGQYLQLEEIRRKNRELAQRNAKHSYLLAGLVFCETHHGKRGLPMRYSGRPRGNYYYYICPVGGCKHANLNGPELECDAKDFAWMLLNLEPDDFYRCIANKENKLELENSLKQELKGLEEKLDKNTSAEAMLESRNLLGQENPRVYEKVKAQLRGRRVSYEDRKEAINNTLAQLDRQEEAVQTLQQIREGFRDKLGQLTDAEWRQLFTELNMEIHVRDMNKIETWPDYWKQEKRFSIASAHQSDIEITFGLPLKAEGVRDIVFTRAGSVYT